MGNLIDLTGQRFGRLVVIGRGADYLTSGGHKFARWRCKCDCGNIVLVKSVHLRNGITKSCGCISAELLEKRNRVHGMRYTKLYEVWKGMKSRCENPKHIGFKDYGGRGISVCEEWRDDFLQFYYGRQRPCLGRMLHRTRECQFERGVSDNRRGRADRRASGSFDQGIKAQCSGGRLGAFLRRSCAFTSLVP